MADRPKSAASQCGCRDRKTEPIDEAKQTFSSTKRDKLLAQAHARIVDHAVLVWVEHDTNPHALS